MTSCNSWQHLGMILAKIFPRSWQDLAKIFLRSWQELAKILLRYPWRVDPGRLFVNCLQFKGLERRPNNLKERLTERQIAEFNDEVY